MESCGQSTSVLGDKLGSGPEHPDRVEKQWETSGRQDWQKEVGDTCRIMALRTKNPIQVNLFRENVPSEIDQLIPGHSVDILHFQIGPDTSKCNTVCYRISYIQTI